VRSRTAEPGTGRRAAPAIYGQILSTAVVATLSEDPDYDVADVLTAVIVTTVVFWLAHVYAESTARRLTMDHNISLPEVGAVAREESTMVLAAIPTVLVLSLAAFEAFSRNLALDLALALGIAELVGLGYVIALRSKFRFWGTVGSIVLTASFGVIIVALKVAVH
jgi:hypothetical protein